MCCKIGTKMEVFVALPRAWKASLWSVVSFSDRWRAQNEQNRGVDEFLFDNDKMKLLTNKQMLLTLKN